MRETKYRALRSDGKGWAIGELNHRRQHTDSPNKCGISFDDGHNGTWVEVIPETVGQYIANNGRQDFYIGDIVINPLGRKHTVVIWDNLPCLHYIDKGRDFYSPMTNGFLANKKVIGNIHEDN